MKIWYLKELKLGPCLITFVIYQSAVGSEASVSMVVLYVEEFDFCECKKYQKTHKALKWVILT